jgi:hypothetical protein
VVVVLGANRTYYDMHADELLLTMSRGEAASLKQGDIVLDVYDTHGRVVYVDETGANAPLLTLQPTRGLQRAYVRLWTELVRLVAAPE